MPTTDQEITGSLPTAEVIRSLAALPLPDEGPGDDPRRLPGGVGLTTPPAAVRRGIGFAVGIKNIFFSEAFDDYAEARAVLTPHGVEMHTAAAEVGQGLVTVLGQIARSATGIQAVEVVFDHTGQIGSAGSTSASRQTQMAGGACLEACRGCAQKALRRGGGDRLDDAGVWRGEELVATLADLLASGPLEHHTRFRHAPTEQPNATGQGNLHAGFCVAAHRAVVDVDPELGLVRVVRVDTAQDVGRALNPLSMLGQIEGRHPAGRGPGDHGGAAGGPGRGAQRLVHRLPDPHHPRRPRGGGGDHRGPGAGRPLRGQGHGRAAHHLRDPRRGGRHPQPPPAAP